MRERLRPEFDSLLVHIKKKGKMFCNSCLNSIDPKAVRMWRGKARERGICPDCMAAVPVKTKFGKCLSHVGDFDKDENPITRSGELILAGFRKCGNSDCINPEHCVGVIRLEQFDLSYRTGVKLSPSEFFERLDNERFIDR